MTHNETPKPALDVTTQWLGGTLITRAYNQFVNNVYDARDAFDRDFREIQFISDHLGGEQVVSRPLDGQGRQLLTGAYGANFDNFRDSFGATLPTVENASCMPNCSAPLFCATTPRWDRGYRAMSRCSSARTTRWAFAGSTRTVR